MTARKKRATATLREAPAQLYEWVAEALTAALDADEQPLVTSFPRRGRLKTSYRVEIDRDGWQVEVFADFISEAVDGTTTPGEPLEYRGLYVSRCRRFADDGTVTSYLFRTHKFGKYFTF